MLLKSRQSAIGFLRLKFDLSVQEAGCSSSKTADTWKKKKNKKNYQMTVLKPGTFKTRADRPLEKWIAESS